MSPANVFLIGPRGCGKSTVGRLLAERLPGWTWLDADAELERRVGRSVRDLFALEGEAGFRARESALLAELADGARRVVSAGGGVVLRADNRELLRKRGRTVYLRAAAGTLRRRLAADPVTADRRPTLLAGAASALDEIEEVLRRRAPLYEGCADLIVAAEGAPEEVTAAVLAFLLSAPRR